jgi:hypothetical protein
MPYNVQYAVANCREWKSRAEQSSHHNAIQVHTGTEVQWWNSSMVARRTKKAARKERERERNNHHNDPDMQNSAYPAQAVSQTGRQPVSTE